MFMSSRIWRGGLYAARYERRENFLKAESETNIHITVCGSLADGKNRPMRAGSYCECDEGWTGINCNVCETNKACNALMPENEGGVCYQNGEVVKENYQMCDVTNVKIVEILDGKKPQVTFTCKDDATCAFQCRCISSLVAPLLTLISLG